MNEPQKRLHEIKWSGGYQASPQKDNQPRDSHNLTDPDEIAAWQEGWDLGKKAKEEGDRFVEAQTEALSQVPEEFRSVIASLAWDRGHSAGYNEILLYVNEYVDSLKKPIQTYTERIKREYRTNNE
jgi:hypothetical protein